MFKRLYRCYSVSLTGTHNYVESGDKILMPVSALEQISAMVVEYPLLFKLRNTTTDKVSHCGVMEFSAEEGTVVLPDWVMKNMNLLEGGLVEVSSASLKKATFVKLRPHEAAFVEVSNPKVVLERSLRGFSCLTVGDTIAIDYLGRKFSIDVLEAKPDEAVSVIETDCEVDFGTPLDYKEPEKPVPPAKLEEEEISDVTAFRPFMGVGRRLDGSTTSSDVTNSVVAPNDAVSRSGCCAGEGRGCNKLAFGGSASKVNNGGTDRGVKEGDKGFKAFSGRSYRLA